MSKESLTLKWGTLKAWKFNEGSPAAAAFKRYCDGPTTMSAMERRDTDAQRQAVLDIIDAVGCKRIFLDWEGRYVSKEAAKDYVRNYGAQ